MLFGLPVVIFFSADTKPSEEEEGTLTEDVPEDQRNTCCISDEMAIKLGKLAQKVRF